MCTPIAHGLAGYAVIILSEPRLTHDFRSNAKALGAGIFFGTLADADFLVAYYTSHPILQHHYFSHSIPFALALGVLLYVFLRMLRSISTVELDVMQWTMILTGAYASHLLLDYFTHDGSRPIGIPLLWPLTDKHFGAPVEIFMSIHRGSMDALFGAHNFLALFREVLLLVPIALIAFFIARRKALTLLPQSSQR